MFRIILLSIFLTGCDSATMQEIMYYQSLQGPSHQQSYQQQRNNDLYMQQGTTGCTPNFSTGACR